MFEGENTGDLMLEELNFTPTTFTDEVAREQSHMLCAQQCRRRGRTTPHNAQTHHEICINFE